MGVTASYCQVCGIPVQQDHYVPMGGMFAIYRGDPEDGHCEPAVPFAGEHIWLKRA